MPFYEIGLRTSNLGTGAASLEIRAPTSTRRVRLWELGITLQAATASTFGLGRPANSGSVAGGTTPASPLAADPADTATPASLFVLAGWTTVPTAPSSFFRRFGFPATIGSGLIWTFRSPIVIPVGGSLVLWNLSAVGAADVYAAVEE